jgi:hypothetical protein
VNHEYTYSSWYDSDYAGPSGTVIIPASFTIINDDESTTYYVKGFEYWENYNYASGRHISVDILDLSNLTTMTDLDIWQIKAPINKMILSSSVNNITCTNINADDDIGIKAVHEFSVPEENASYKTVDGVLYTKDGTYLQVIRPNLNDFSTDKLDGAEYTVLAPHFDDEPDVDGHVAVFLECMNQTEQTIDVLR